MIVCSTSVNSPLLLLALLLSEQLTLPCWDGGLAPLLLEPGALLQRLLLRLVRRLLGEHLPLPARDLVTKRVHVGDLDSSGLKTVTFPSCILCGIMNRCYLFQKVFRGKLG